MIAMYVKQFDHGWLVRLERGEKVVESLKIWCGENSIEGGFLVGLGAVDEVELAHYDVETKTYSTVKFGEPFEVTNLTGSIGIGEQLVVHAHISLGRKDMSMVGGHLVEARVSGTMEMWVMASEDVWRKVKDEKTGLWVFG